MKQTEKVLRHLREFGEISSLTAMSEYGIMRLASRISDLKKQGFHIVGKLATGKNRYGETTHYSVYRFVEGEQK